MKYYPLSFYLMLLGFLEGASTAHAQRLPDTKHRLLAHAQHKPAATKSLKKGPEFVVATAVRRVNGGLSSTNLSAKRLETVGILDTRGLITQVAGLYQAKSNFSFASANYTVRGITDMDGQASSPVGSYVDGVFIPRQNGAMQELLDVSNVEVDKGPSGFAGGHRSEAGAVRIGTVVPDGTYHAALLGGVGTYDEYRLAGSIRGAIVAGKLFGSLSVDRHGRDGVDRMEPSRKQVNNIDYTTARAKLRYLPNDRWDMILSVEGTVDGSTKRAYADATNADPYMIHNPVFPKNFTRIFMLNQISKYHINEHLTFSAQTAVQGYDEDDYTQHSGDSYASNVDKNHYATRAYSEDLNLKGEYDGLEFSTGAYFYAENWNQNRRTMVLSSTSATNRDASKFNVIDLDQKINTYDASVYGEVKYYITPRLLLTAGLRFDREYYSTSAQMYQVGASTGVAWPQALDVFYNSAELNPAWSVNSHSARSMVLPELSAKYFISPNVSVFGGWSKGSRQGGFDWSASSLGSAGRTDAGVTFNPETLTTYEAGLKLNFFNQKLNVSGNLFYNVFQNIQYTTTDPSFQISRRFNAGNARSEGGEIEATFAPTRNWYLYANFTYVYSRMTSINSPYKSISLADGSKYNTSTYVGAPLANSPRYQANVGAYYTLPKFMSGSWRVGSDISFLSKTNYSILNNPQTLLPSQTYVNALLEWRSDNSRWTTLVKANNLVNHRYPQYAGAQQSGGVIYGQPIFYSDPRTVFFSVKYAF
ncbi:TonB-dependent receptor [Acetobacter persici]|uniref:TonB-dependent receptor n=1 Tax=Acetobacter persici TaxID=1076596 RepID=UPI001BAA9A6F|nr:TonB-dependent receptor [Acetobacter persici]MBS1017274.1 TonB-dependent receptor [Acetobacter persici]